MVLTMARKKDVHTGKGIVKRIVVLLVVVGIAVTVIFLSAIVGVIYLLNLTGGVQLSTMMTTVGMWVMVLSILFSCVFCNCPIVSPAESENFAKFSILGGICAIIGAFLYIIGLLLSSVGS